MAKRIFDLFGGEIDWQALPWVAEMYGCEDLETLCELLVVIRTHAFEQLRDNGN